MSGPLSEAEVSSLRSQFLNNEGANAHIQRLIATVDHLRAENQQLKSSINGTMSALKNSFLDEAVSD